MNIVTVAEETHEAEGDEEYDEEFEENDEFEEDYDEDSLPKFDDFDE